jgi:hypothetical protein
VVCDGNQPLFLCGATFADAAQVLQVLQRFQFDHLVRVGDTEPAPLTFLVKAQ